jgi:hypothetical protein
MRTVEIPDSYKLEIGRESQWFPLAESAVQALRFKFDAPLTRILSKDESVVGRNPLRAALAEDHRRDSQDYDQWSLLGYYYLGESASGIEGERSGRKITLDLVKAQLNSAQEAKAPSSWKLTLFLWTDPALPDELPDFVSANFSFQ